MTRGNLIPDVPPFKTLLCFHRMPKDTVLTEENFELLLRWLDPDADAAARKYERIRSGLIRIIRGRGCHEAEDLTDQTFDRVSGKLSNIIETYKGDPSLYFYGVARKLVQEWSRKAFINVELQLLVSIPSPENTRDDLECLEKCLNELPVIEKELIVAYYQDLEPSRIRHRQNLAEQLGIAISRLQVRTSRIRKQLFKCLAKCSSLKKV